MNKYSAIVLTGLRIIVGWHFLYEGVSKLLNPGWTAKMYLLGSRWIFSDIFHWMANSLELMKFVDLINVWGLILVGLSLLFGLFVRQSSIFGSILLLMYFLAYPPIPGYTLGVITEGNYLWINKTLIEFFILLVFIFLPLGFSYGIDRLMIRWREEKVRTPVPSSDKKSGKLSRRILLRNLIGVPAIGAFAYALYRKKKWDSFEEKFLVKDHDAKTGATMKNHNFTSLNELKEPVPMAKIGDFELSRMIMGGNLIGGWAHSRDLIYVSKLVKAYHTDSRVLQTLELAEKCGINGILTNPRLARVINKYWHETRGKMKFISDCGIGNNFIEGIKMSIDGGANACYCQGEISDRKVMAGEFDEIERGIQLIRDNNLPAGIGAHRIETIKACVERGIKPDFWIKTLHNHNYWSAQHGGEWKDNLYCYKPEETIEFMNDLEEPWIAFKVLAAGAIQPKEGFQYAFDNGADFICVGMYDFQIVENINILNDTLTHVSRKRPWRA